ncbi:MAG: SH3 domain-containing protein [Anaerolineae bacterium]|nr:SH3 domain-containing protein [Anaerolineae bacterium]
MKRIPILMTLALALLLVGLIAPTVLVPGPTVQAQAGASWIGQFYNSTDLSGSIAAYGTYLNGLSQNWGFGQPSDDTTTLTAVNPDNFSARFTADVAFSAGLYEFVITADDGVRLFINGLPVIDNFGHTGLATVSAIVNLSGPATVIVEYVERVDLALIQVQWFPTSGTSLAPTATTAPLAIGVVNYVRGLAVRTGPFLGASMVAVARPDVQYPLLARNEREGLFTWYLIQYDEDTVGWSSGRYLFVEGDEEVLPYQDSIFPSLPVEQYKGVTGITRSVMNLRQYPSPRTPLLAQIPWGGEVQILSRTVQGGMNFWYQVRWGDQIGWILAAYVGINNGLIDAVPVY